MALSRGMRTHCAQTEGSILRRNLRWLGKLEGAGGSPRSPPRASSWPNRICLALGSLCRDLVGIVAFSGGRWDLRRGLVSKVKQDGESQKLYLGCLLPGPFPPEEAASKCCSDQAPCPSTNVQHGFVTRLRAGGRGNPPPISWLQPPSTCPRCANI